MSIFSLCKGLYFYFINLIFVNDYQIISAKAVVQVDFPAYALSMHKQNALRITKGNTSNRIGP